MAISYVLEPDFARIRAEGHYTYQEVVAAFLALVAEADRRLPILLDARESLANPDLGEMRLTAEFADSIAPQIGPRIALVVEGTLRFGLARMLAALGSREDRLEYRAFRDLVEAEDWLRG